MAGLDALFRNVGEFRKPFGEYVTTGTLGALGGLYWEEDKQLDFDYHVRRSALPRPGRYRELFALISRLHGTRLDRNRPLWEAYLIDGLKDRQFAVYLKMHHAAIDGVGGMKMVSAFCSTNKRTRRKYSPLSMEAYQQLAQSSDKADKLVPRKRELTAVVDVLRQQFGTSLNLAGVAGDYLKTVLGGGGGLAIPFFRVPRSPISARITGARRFVAQSWSLDRVRAVGAALDGTINDTVLAMCAGALRRYLLQHDVLPQQSLKALVPVSIRNENDADSSNAIGSISADLATHLADPEQRYRQIQLSMQRGKEVLRGLSGREAELLWQLTQAPALLMSMLGLSDRFPIVSLTISNVPGSPKPLYLNGAAVDGLYPVSIPFDGMAMNITMISYNNKLDFGIVACRRSLPQLQRMIDYLEDSLAELEKVAGTEA
jgi:diacylglycerol O-acyltransferase